MIKDILKKLVALIITLLIIELEGLFAASVPVDSVGVKWVSGKKFIEYKVEEHDGWYGIARKFGIAYSDVRLANKEVDDVLHIGQVILVPASKVKPNDPRNRKNYIVKEQEEPVYHAVKKKETLYSISKKYNVSTDDLKKWNHLETNDLKDGAQVIIGYKTTKVKMDAEKVLAEEKKAVAPEKKEVIEKGTPLFGAETKKTEPVHDSLALAKPANGKIVGDTQTIKKSFATVTRKEISEQGVATWIDDENINPNKYFALHRTAPVGTIIKVINRMNKRSVFVKVVGKLPDTGDNDNTVIKISKASAEKLGVRDPRFQSELTYGINEKQN
jgi:LysM repeat protein